MKTSNFNPLTLINEPIYSIPYNNTYHPSKINIQFIKKHDFLKICLKTLYTNSNFYSFFTIKFFTKQQNRIYNTLIKKKE